MSTGMLRSLKCWGQRVLQRSFLQLKPLKKVTTAIFIVLHFLYGDKVYPVLAAEIAVNNFVLAAENIPVTILRFKTLLCIIVIGTVTVIDDAEKFTSEMHDPYTCSRYLQERTTQKYLQRAPVWSRPNTLRRLSQKCFYNSRVLERS